MQKIIIIGTISKDFELKTSKSGVSFCKLNIPIKEKFGDKETTEWFDIMVFGKQAEFCAKYLAKGCKVYIEAKKSTKDIEKNGVKEKQVSFIATELEPITWKERSKSESYKSDFQEEYKKAQDIEKKEDEEDGLPF